MQLNHGPALLLGCALTLGSACAGQEGSAVSSGGDNGTPTLSPETVVADMSAADGAAFCEMAVDLLEADDALETHPTILCTKEGLIARFTSDDGEVATCEAVRDSCLEETGQGQGAPTLLDCATEPDLESCDITFAEFETCRTVVEALLEQALATAACDISAEKSLEMRAIMLEGHPAECAPLTERCPLFVGFVSGTE